MPPLGLMRRLAFGALAASFACDDPAGGAANARASASVTAAAAPHEIDESVIPQRHPVDPNPLGLPPATVTLAAGQRVFVVPERMLGSAKLGRSLQLASAKVEAMNGHDAIVRIGHGAAYTVHPGYLVAPKRGRVQHGMRVIARSRDHLRHAIVQRPIRDKIAVRFSDAGAMLGDQQLDPDDIGVLAGELEPGAYALERSAHGYEHVLLVSSAVHGDGAKRWLVLGAAGEARLIDEKHLSPVPDASRLKPGSAVLVAWRGEMVPGTVRAIDPSGLYGVKRPRVGPALVVGPDMLMPAPAPPK